MANLVAPSFMKMSAKRGLALHAEGESGDGLKPATVGDARKMVEGQALSEDKWRRIAPWIARHISDLDAVQGDEITAGLVAMLLWGGGSSKSSARRTQAYAERIVAQLDATEERAPAPKKDQIKGSKKNPAGSATGKKGGIELSKETEKALRNKLEEHNEKMKDRPVWTRTTLGALKAVYRRGSGAFSGSHRPGIGRAQWSMARVNAFLHLCRVGRPKNPKYITDYDLLNKAHPKYSGKRYDADQPREDDGKFGEGGGGGGDEDDMNFPDLSSPDFITEDLKIPDISDAEAERIGKVLDNKDEAFSESGATLTEPLEDEAMVAYALTSVTGQYDALPKADQQRLETGKRMTEGALISGRGNSGDIVVSAVDDNGNIAGAIAYSGKPRNGEGDTVRSGGAITIENLGSMGIVDGTGSKLFLEAARHAAETNSGLALEALDKSAGSFWKSMGFRYTEEMPVDLMYLSPESVQKIAKGR